MAESSNPLSMTEMKGRGRSIIASRAIKAGEILLTESPILLYPANPTNKKFCSYCYKNLNTSSTILPCPSCSHHTLFCTPTCHSKALSSSHSQFVCQALTSLPPLSPDDLSAAHFLVAASNLAAISPSQFNILLSLEGAADSTSNNPKTLALHSLISTLSPPQPFSLEITAALLAKDERNAFALMEDEENVNVRAYGIYPNASFFNHDCLPNAARFDYVDTRNTDIIVRAIHDFDQGREICLSYFGVTWKYGDRQKRLTEDYGFVCDCDRCKVEAKWKDDDGDDGMEENGDDQMVGEEEEDGEEMEDDFPHAYFFLKYVCSRENCGGTLAPLPPPEGVTSGIMECNVCGQLRSAEEVDADEGEDGVMVG